MRLKILYAVMTLLLIMIALSVRAGISTFAETPPDLPEIQKAPDVSNLLQPGEAVERVDLRTRNAKVFQKADGAGYALVYMNPVHYQTAPGQWAEIDNRLIADPDRAGGWRNAANDLTVRFSGATAAVVRAQGLTQAADTFLSALSVGDQTLAFHPLDMAPTPGDIEGSAVRYSDVYPSVDLRYYVTADGVKEEFVFQRLPDKKQFTFLLQVAGGQPVLAQNGAIYLEPCIESCLSILPPYMEDAGGQFSEAIQVSLEALAKNRYLLTYEPDFSWLTAAERVYPVVLDPSPERSAVTYGLYIEAGAPATSSCNAQRLVTVGYETNAIQDKLQTRTFLYFDLPPLPNGNTVTAARLYAYQYALHPGNTGGYTTQVYRVTSEWANDATCKPNTTVWTWNNPPSINNTIFTTQSIGTGIGWKNWTITNLVRIWYSGTPNNGLAIFANPETARGSYFCSNVASGSVCNVSDAQNYHPYAIIEYDGPKITTGLTLSPSTQSTNADVTASFTIRNDGGQTVSFDLRVTAGADNFATVTQNIGSGSSYTYSQTRQFSTAGTVSACAQYRVGGSWQNLPEAGGTACRNLTLATPPDTVVISGPSLGQGIINVPTTFTATVNPATTTQPLTYDWQATDQPASGTSSGLNHAMSFSWTTPGTKTITVTASNAGGDAMTSHDFRVLSPGDCNNDFLVDAGDDPAIILEIFDNDGADPVDANAPEGTFAGTLACDANEDGLVDAGDGSCLPLLIFNGPGACSK